MAIVRNGEVLGQVRTLFAIGSIGELSDGQLLERFATGRGDVAERAFAALVERHGPMVLRVCRGVLVDSHDSHDAFQATFLVLVRRARALWVHDSLGPWLHQVAYRTSSCLRTGIARRRRLERDAAEQVREGRVEIGDELVRALHDELGRLPERFRAPVVLCDLEASTHEQAARHLGWPIGTVKSRLTRAREILRDRLRRRGFGPDFGLIVALRPRGVEALLPPALVDSTTRAVVQSVASRTILPGSATSLAREVLRTMLIPRWMKAGTLLAVAAATVSGAGALAQKPAADSAPGAIVQRRADDLPAVEVKPGKFRVAVVERGVVEAMRADNVTNTVEGTTTIIFILPEGTKVKKGDKVCELNSAGLRDDLHNQRITVTQAEANRQNAAVDREVAELALRESEETYRAEQQALRGTIAASRSTKEKAGARLERTRRARQRLDVALAARKGEATPADIVAELDVDDRLEDATQLIAREKAALEVAETRLDVLQKFTAERTRKERTIDIERKRSTELARKAALKIEKDKETKLERQIRNCVLNAPSDGVIVYANDPGRYGRGNRVQIEEGAAVRERQIILSVVDTDGPMRINTKVKEARVDRVQRGQRARIKVDAFPGRELTGVVQQVYPLPDPNAAFAGWDTKVYTTLVRLDERFAGLRPGMTAGVEIPIVELDNVLAMPVAAVLRFDGKDHVAVKAPGGFEWREVTLGDSDGERVEVKRGLRSGESVILEPSVLMSEAERRAKLGAPTKPAASPPQPAR